MLVALAVLTPSFDMLHFTGFGIKAYTLKTQHVAAGDRLAGLARAPGGGAASHG
jgi:hypothetical protein